LTELIVRKKLSLLPNGITPGAREEGRVEAVDSVVCPVDTATLMILISIRHEPMASAVYLQNIGTVDVDENLRERGANEINALPMNEYSGKGVS
jgi:hypothetical protein